MTQKRCSLDSVANFFWKPLEQSNKCGIQALSLAVSIITGVATLGSVHTVCLLYLCLRPKQPELVNQTISNVARNSLTQNTPNTTTNAPSLNIEQTIVTVTQPIIQNVNSQGLPALRDSNCMVCREFHKAEGQYDKCSVCFKTYHNMEWITAQRIKNKKELELTLWLEKKEKEHLMSDLAFKMLDKICQRHHFTLSPKFFVQYMLEADAKYITAKQFAKLCKYFENKNKYQHMLAGYVYDYWNLEVVARENGDAVCYYGQRRAPRSEEAIKNGLEISHRQQIYFLSQNYDDRDSLKAKALEQYNLNLAALTNQLTALGSVENKKEQLSMLIDQFCLFYPQTSDMSKQFSSLASLLASSENVVEKPHLPIVEQLATEEHSKVLSSFDSFADELTVAIISVYGDQVPDDYNCPISLELITDPVVIPTCPNNFERKMIEAALKDNECPMTRQKCNKDQIIANDGLKTLITKWEKAKESPVAT